MSIINVYLIFFKSSYFNRNQLKNTGYFYKLKQFFKNKIKVSRVRWRRVTMASANWNQETKSRLNEKISGNMNDLGSLARQIVRGSHSSDVSECILLHFKVSYWQWREMSSKNKWMRNYLFCLAKINTDTISYTFIL